MFDEDVRKMIFTFSFRVTLTSNLLSYVVILVQRHVSTELEVFVTFLSYFEKIGGTDRWSGGQRDRHHHHHHIYSPIIHHHNNITKKTIQSEGCQRSLTAH